MSCPASTYTTVHLQPTGAPVPLATTVTVNPSGASPITDEATNPAPTTSKSFDV